MLYTYSRCRSKKGRKDWPNLAAQSCSFTMHINIKTEKKWKTSLCQLLDMKYFLVLFIVCSFSIRSANKCADGALKHYWEFAWSIRYRYSHIDTHPHIPTEYQLAFIHLTKTWIYLCHLIKCTANMVIPKGYSYK